MYCQEPRARFSDYLAEYLNSGFKVRQIGNTYNAISNGLEQMMILLILFIGAWIMMNPSTGQAPAAGQGFTPICMFGGMLVAFQMFAGRLSQAMLELARYAALNSVRARMVKDVADWPWSSYAAMTGGQAAPDWLQTDWILGQFSAQRRRAINLYVDFVRAGVGLPSLWDQLSGQL